MKPTPPSLLEMLHGLIAAPSMSSVSPEFDTSNRQVIDRLALWLEGLGFAVEVLPLPKQPHKANLIATLGKGPGGLVLAGHTDTVPYDAGRWNHDPFSLTEADGRLYGLGTSDMKGFFALAIEAARVFDSAEFKHPLIILATADEESSMEGAQALVELGRPRARYAVIGEPTGLKPVNAHKGIMMEAIRLTGRSGHSSDPSLGLNAIEGMHKVLGDLLAWRDEPHSFQYGWRICARSAAGRRRRCARELIAGWCKRYGWWHAVAWRPAVMVRRVAAWPGHYEFCAASADAEMRARFFRALLRQLP